jgi:hypothetical protein
VEASRQMAPEAKRLYRKFPAMERHCPTFGCSGVGLEASRANDISCAARHSSASGIASTDETKRKRTARRAAHASDVPGPLGLRVATRTLMAYSQPPAM